jgi:hypothetical protein
MRGEVSGKNGRSPSLRLGGVNSGVELAFARAARIGMDSSCNERTSYWRRNFSGGLFFNLLWQQFADK